MDSNLILSAKKSIDCKTSIYLLILSIICFGATAQTRYYVNQNMPISGIGTSWETAFKTLQEAMDKTSSVTVDEIWVAEGTYLPTRTPYGTNFTPPSRNHTFYFSRNMKVFGGFAGTETSFNQRDWEAHPTILSGNRGALDDSTDNFYHVVLAIGTEDQPLTNELVIDGFIITGGYANFQGVFGDVKGSTVYNYNGGGVYNIYASPTLSNLQVVKNVGFVGGGIFNRLSSPKINNVTVSENYAGSNGGGIYNILSATHINNSVISNNFVNNIGGGGICNESSSNILISNTTISNNKAPDGGGIYNTSCNVNLENVVVENNNGGEGGGIFNSSEVKLYMKDVQIKNNIAKYGGGLNNFRDSIYITGGSISGNKADFGGGMYSDGTYIETNGTQITDNEATLSHGGGLHAIKESTLIFKNLFLKNNIARANGGGLNLLDSSTATFEGGEISNNRAGAFGGGICMNKSVNPLRQMSLANVTISSNRGHTGAGIYDEGSMSKYNNVQFISNNTSNNGGGIYASLNTSPEFQNVLFEKNQATRGAGIYNDAGTNVKISDATFISNLSTIDGGGLYNNGNAFLNRVQFKGNKATTGAALYNRMPSTIVNTLFSGNSASTLGGAIWQREGTPILINSTISGNNASSGGGAIYVANIGVGNIQNSIIYGNSSGIAGVLSNISISYSLVQGITSTDNGNMSGEVDPLFMNTPDYNTAPFTTGDYHLQQVSPVIDKGNNAVYDAGNTPDFSAIKTDLEGNARIYNNKIDMGAFENQPTLPIQLLSFKLKQSSNRLQLVWITAQHQNILRFEVQRGENASEFVTIGKVDAAQGDQYYFEDQHFPNSGTVYYRLKMIETNGAVTYSTIEFANFTKASNIAFTIYPNPSSSYLSLIGKNNQQLKAYSRLFNADGKLVLESKVNPISVSKLPAGLYLLIATSIVDGIEQTFTKRVLIHRP
jgi:predicted outer membrane repeat protein